MQYRVVAFSKQEPGQLESHSEKPGMPHLGPPAAGAEGLDVSPDGQVVLYDRVDEFDSDIMLVENFH